MRLHADRCARAFRPRRSECLVARFAAAGRSAIKASEPPAGGATDRSENAPLASELAARGFTAINYDRRGRGKSGDDAPYSVTQRSRTWPDSNPASWWCVERRCARARGRRGGRRDRRLAVYEVPYNIAPDWPQRWRAYVEELEALLAAGRRGDAFAHFMRLAEVPDADIEAARGAPFWADLEALAPTLAYDAACLGEGGHRRGSPRSPSPCWSSPASATGRSGCARSARPRTRSSRSSPARGARRSRTPGTSPIRRRSPPLLRALLRATCDPALPLSESAATHVRAAARASAPSARRRRAGRASGRSSRAARGRSLELLGAVSRHQRSPAPVLSRCARSAPSSARSQTKRVSISACECRSPAGSTTACARLANAAGGGPRSPSRDRTSRPRRHAPQPGLEPEAVLDDEVREVVRELAAGPPTLL